MQRLKKFLFEDEAIVGITKLTDYLYWRILRYDLIFINAWPSKEVGEKPYKSLMVFTVVLSFIYVFYIHAGPMYMIKHSAELTFFELGHMYITWFMAFVVGSRIIFTLRQNYKDATGFFITKLHLFYYKDVSDYAMKTHKRIHMISHIFTMFLTWQKFIGVTLFNLIPIWNNYSSGKFGHRILYNTTFEHSIYFSAPFEIHTHFNAYLCATIYNWIISYITSSSFCSLDLLLSLIVFHIWGHFKILIHDLDSFALPAKAVLLSKESNMTINEEMYSEEESKEVSVKLIRCIDYHRFILNHTKNISDTFGPILLIYLIFHQVSGCLLLLECSQMTLEALLRYLPLTVILFQQLIQLSVIFELIGTTSEKLMHTVYGVPWECMDTKNRRTVGIFLMNAQRPVHVKALGVVNVGVTTMATILKTSLSFFAFLRTL